MVEQLAVRGVVVHDQDVQAVQLPRPPAAGMTAPEDGAAEA
jgi:hypothetical protein